MDKICRFSLNLWSLYLITLMSAENTEYQALAGVEMLCWMLDLSHSKNWTYRNISAVEEIPCNSVRFVL